MTPLKIFLTNLVLFIVSFIIAKFEENNYKLIDYIASILFLTLIGNLIWCIFYYVKI